MRFGNSICFLPRVPFNQLVAENVSQYFIDIEANFFRIQLEMLTMDHMIILYIIYIYIYINGWWPYGKGVLFIKILLE